MGQNTPRDIDSETFLSILFEVTVPTLKSGFVRISSFSLLVLSPYPKVFLSLRHSRNSPSLPVSQW